MVVMQRAEIGWYRTICYWALLCSLLMPTWFLWLRWGPGETGGWSGSKLGTILLVLLCLAFAISSLLGLWRFRKRSRVILFKQGEEILLFTNKFIDEDYKFQFLRDVVAEKVVNRYRENPPPPLPVNVEGYRLALVFLNANEPLIRRYCKMLFDDVYLNDPDHVWVHYDSGNTYDPDFWDKKRPDGRPAAQSADTTAKPAV